MRRQGLEIAIETFELIRILKKGIYTSKQELCGLLNISVKTLERRLAAIRNSNAEYYLVCERGKGYRLVQRKAPELVKHFPPKIKQPINWRQEQNADVRTHIKLLSGAIERKCWVNLAYYSITGTPKSTRAIFPVSLLLEDTPYLLAVTDVNKPQLRTYRLDRIEKCVVTGIRHEPGVQIPELHFDDFGMLQPSRESLSFVKLYLTRYAAEMIKHDFPGFSPKIIMLPERQTFEEVINGLTKRFQYQICINVGVNIGALARVIAGMLADIIVYEAEALVRMKIYNCIQENTISSINNHILHNYE